MRDDGSKPVTETIEKPPAAVTGCVLRLTDGDDAGREVELMRGTISVGAAPGQTLRLSDPTVSGQHARVTLVAGGVEVEDLQSRNGTFYLESQISRAVLPIGATIRFGRTRVQVASRAIGREASGKDRYGDLLGESAVMQRLYKTLEQLERITYPVLVLGETGVGKELVAREIHAHSNRSKGAYEICDCTTLPRTLAESELFGHMRGAFTGAVDTRAGVFERADRGTIFIDEIGELPLDLQPKLLRVLESQEVRRLGASELRKIDVRVIAATNRDLLAESRDGRFREDLFYRLNTVTIEVPPLRERREDVPALVRKFINDDSRDPQIISRETLELFTTGYDWPGNVRELRNAVRRVLALGGVTYGLPGTGERDAAANRLDTNAQFQDAKRTVVDAFERDYLNAQLRLADNNISHAARNSGVERMQFKRLLKKHGLL